MIPLSFSLLLEFHDFLSMLLQSYDVPVVATIQDN